MWALGFGNYLEEKDSVAQGQVAFVWPQQAAFRKRALFWAIFPFSGVFFRHFKPFKSNLEACLNNVNKQTLNDRWKSALCCRKHTGLGVKKTPSAPVYHLFPAWPWTTHFSSLGLSFSICKIKHCWVVWPMPLSFLRTVATLKLRVPFPGSALSCGQTRMVGAPNIRLCDVSVSFRFKSQTLSPSISAVGFPACKILHLDSLGDWVLGSLNIPISSLSTEIPMSWEIHQALAKQDSCSPSGEGPSQL